MAARVDEITLRLSEIKASGATDWVSQFEARLADLVRLSDPACIPLALALLDDRCPFDEVMFSVVHAVEGSPDRPYVAGLLAQIEQLAGQAPRWSRILFMRVLNSDSARAELVEQLRRAAPGIRGVSIKVVDDIAARRPEFAQKAIQVRTAALANP
jgi:hypothetical protein